MDDTSIRSPTPTWHDCHWYFLFFGAPMASLAGITLVCRGTALDRMWTLNPRAHNELAPLGQPMSLLSYPLRLRSHSLAQAG